MDFLSHYDKYKRIAEDYFLKVFDETLCDGNLQNAVRYSFFGGGKRVRPVLMLAVSEYLGVNFSKVLPYALSLECVHIHSLIHDDLPPLDNDDFRRGLKSCHKAYGEACALLAGDYLLNFAYFNGLRNCVETRDATILSLLSDATAKMLDGQALDSAYLPGSDEKTVLDIYKNKTCALLTACFTIPLALSDKKINVDFIDFAENFGLLFQITDDIIDYSLKSNKKNNELNFVSEFGIERALKLKLNLINKCYKTLDKLGDFEFLKLFVDFVAERCE